jgi:DNA polymerase III subunit gamma/tau
VVLHAQLVAGVHLVHYEPGRLEFRPADGAPADLANRLDRALRDWTGERWAVAVSGAPGESTLAEQARDDRQKALAAAAQHPLVRAVIDAFPGAVIRDIRNPLELSRVALAEAPPPSDEEERP